MHRLPRRVLVLDDSEDDREWVARLLRADPNYRYELVAVGTVADALNTLGESSVDVVLADCDLPDGSGLDFIAALQKRAEHVPVIVITGHDRPRQIEEVLRSGAHDFLPKDDLSERTLLRTVEQATVRARLERELFRAREAESAAVLREREARVAAELALANGARSRALIGRLQVLGIALGNALSVRDVADTVVSYAGAFEQALAASLYLLDGTHLVLQSHFGFKESEVEPWRKLDVTLRTPITEAARRGEQLVISNLDELRRQYPGLSVSEQFSWVATPLHTEREVIGALGLRFLAGATLDAEVLTFLTLVAELLTQAIVRARLFERAREQAELEHRLLAVIGHDLRTPLSAISMAAGLLRERTPRDAVVERLARSAHRMRSIIDDVLSRSEVQGRARAHEASEQTDLEGLVRDQLDELRTAFPDRAIHYETSDVPSVRVHASRMSQILANLVRNALQYGDPEEQVWVLLARDKEEISLSVQNRGPTIPAEMIPQLFDPFRRGPTAGGAGYGLGLFIVRECAEQLGGTMDVSSGDGVTTFTFRMRAIALP